MVKRRDHWIIGREIQREEGNERKPGWARTSPLRSLSFGFLFPFLYGKDSPDKEKRNQQN
jgi:hypothetical protein